MKISHKNAALGSFEAFEELLSKLASIEYETYSEFKRKEHLSNFVQTEPIKNKFENTLKQAA